MPSKSFEFQNLITSAGEKQRQLSKSNKMNKSLAIPESGHALVEVKVTHVWPKSFKTHEFAGAFSLRDALCYAAMDCAQARFDQVAKGDLFFGQRKLSWLDQMD